MHKEVKMPTTPQASASLLQAHYEEADQAQRMSTTLLVWFILLHVPLALLLRNYSILSSVHAALVFAIGLGAALLRPKDDLLPLWAAAYIVGAEVLWRRTGAADQLAWEFGKYTVIIILGIAALRRHRRRHLPPLPLFYIACLLPSIAFFLGLDVWLMRYRVMGNLVGPLSLTVCAIYFTDLKLDDRSLRRLALIMLAPTVATAALSSYNIVALGDELWFGQSSSHFIDGPNQVSNSLALGGVLCLLLLSRWRSEGLLRFLWLGILGGLLVLNLLVFSRGGVYTLGLVVLCTLPLVLKNNPHRWRLSLLLILFFAVMIYFIWPWLNDFTSGAVGLRYANLESSRWELARSEIKVWLDNPIFGVGPGLAREEVWYYMEYGRLQAHMEFTRLLAEHGLFGLLALIFLIVSPVKNYKRANKGEARVWVMAATLFALAYMGQAATRTIAPGFMYGLTWATLFATGAEQNHLLDRDVVRSRKVGVLR